MGWIGWSMLDSGEYKIPLPKLSEEEASVIDAVCTEFSDTAKDEEISNSEAARKHIQRILEGHLARHRISVEKDQLAYLAEAAFVATYGYGPLTYLLEDDSLEEIAVIGIGTPVYVFRRKGGWVQANFAFTDRQWLIDTVNKMARSIGRRVTTQNPRLNALLPDGSRLHATIEPISELEVTIRKFRRSPVSLADLLDSGYTYELLAFLWMVFEGDRNVIVCGNTAAGKTSTLNALFSFVPRQERVIMLEETPEISIPHTHQLKMKTSREQGIGMKDLIEDSLRMRPDRVIIGEVRSKEEIHAMIESMSAGQARGCYATLHANSARELVSRLRQNEVLATDMGSIDLIIVQRRMLQVSPGQKLNEMRKVVEVCELAESAGSVAIRQLFRLDPKTGKVVRTQVRPHVLEEIAFSSGATVEEVEREIARRSTYLKSALSKKGADASALVAAYK